LSMLCVQFSKNLLIGNQRNFIKSIGTSKHIGSIQKGHKKVEKTKETKKPQTPHRNQLANPRRLHHSKGLLAVAKARTATLSIKVNRAL
jgi:hypothetical protein